MDTKFSVAIHILVMITESERSLSSQALAISVEQMQATSVRLLDF